MVCAQSTPLFLLVGKKVVTSGAGSARALTGPLASEKVLFYFAVGLQAWWLWPLVAGYHCPSPEKLRCSG